MELGLSLGDQSASSPFMFLPKHQQKQKQQQHSMSNGNGNGNGLLKNRDKICGLGLGICMGLGINSSAELKQNDDIDAMEDDHTSEDQDDDDDEEEEVNGDDHRDVSSLQQLDLLPLLSVPPRCPSSSHNNHSRRSSGKGFNVNSLLQLGGGGGGAATACEVTSANSVASSARFPMDFDLFKGGGGNLSSGGGTEGKDDDEDETYINGVNAKKKLRLSKEQSAFLEESFKEHHTLNPKQKLALAKQLNLRPRQIEVWFQNRRARTKLKQTEVDCEYLKRCCETLTEENKRLHKELQELRVLKNSNPFYMQVPATTLTMCSSCEKITTTTTTSTPPPTTNTTTNTNPAAAVSATNPITTTTTKAIPFPLSRSTRHALPFSSKNN